ncbi:3-hydroxyacyl-CoA dehydrogenase NAD-binding domain-containing protein [Lentisalinibacter sediminis]|uniref:3-hydroxyacyl-CoA dehydrogenase NAD-binding domain-containing protein n=1 Tax=Lentisalinibacter sediminis TaxID=2992237 RepID=UPI003868DC63
MSTMNTIDFQVDGDGIATITIDVKDRPMNVLTPEFMAELKESIEKVASDDAIKGAVITSGKDSFLAGADLKSLVNAFDSGASAEEMYANSRGLQQTLRTMETCGKPFAAAINGTALGGGLEICLATHYRVAADNPKAVLGLPEVQVGLLPGGGGTQRLPRLIGLEASLPLMLQGTHVKPEKAGSLGIVHEVVEPGKEVEAAKKWIRDVGDPEQPWDKKGFKVPGGTGLMNPKAIQTLMVGSALLQKNTNHNYPAPIAIMSCAYEGTVLPIDQGLDIESKYFVSLLRDPVARNMTRTLFINKGAADKLVRRPKGVDKSQVKKLGVLGAGMMGAGIAFVSAKAGMEVILLDTAKDKAEKGKDYSRELLQKRIDRGKMDSDKAADLLELIRTTDDYADLEGCDLIIEAVFEDRKIKADVTARTEAVIPENAIFASNTSTLPITGLAEASKRPEQFIGIHFFSPVDKMPLVEVIVGEKTGDEAIARSLDYIQQIRKTPIVVNDSRGFYTSRVFGTFTREGMSMLAEGVNPALIENVAKQAGMPVGPLAVTDEVSLELAYHVGKQTREDLGDDYVGTPADEVVRKFVEDLDRRGKRFGKGFYDYPEGGKKQLWPGLAEHFPVADEQPSVEEVKTRLLYIQALDTVRCMDEGVVTDPADADVGSIFGWGFPPYTGGTISLIETVGLKEFVAECDRMAEAYGERFKVPAMLREMAEKGETFYPRGSASETRSAA